MSSSRWRPALRICSTDSPWRAIHVVEFEQLPEADDRVERGAQLVAHPREELALGLVGALGLRAGGFRGLLRGLAVGDVL